VIRDPSGMCPAFYLIYSRLCLSPLAHPDEQGLTTDSTDKTDFYGFFLCLSVSALKKPQISQITQIFYSGNSAALRLCASFFQ
jgi:hypothetical protein